MPFDWYAVNEMVFIYMMKLNLGPILEGKSVRQEKRHLGQKHLPRLSLHFFLKYWDQMPLLSGLKILRILSDFHQNWKKSVPSLTPKSVCELNQNILGLSICSHSLNMYQVSAESQNPWLQNLLRLAWNCCCILCISYADVLLNAKKQLQSNLNSNGNRK